MRWCKLISILLHPLVMPTLGFLLYLLYVPNTISYQQKGVVLIIIIIATYVIPFLLLTLLKALGFIKSFKVETIKERKIPLFFMIVLFFVLGKIFYTTPNFRFLGYLFYGTDLGLLLIYIFYFFNIKVSFHLLSIGSAIGFFLILSYWVSFSVLPIVIVLIGLAGLLASARLNLKAHTPKEVYLGFFLGLSCQFIMYYLLTNQLLFI
ncbi:hypothetical protein [Tenacibaculum sp. UWU-22]|uniref:hypothetical protein n=1 Tax=Tenacibaculum sp. UWU-22 TaxID=3234187 RepID=UPI0034DB4B40